MLTPEESAAKAKWLRETYKDHYAYLRRVYGARKKGIANAEEYAQEQLQAYKDKVARQEYLRTHFSSRMQYLAELEHQRNAKKAQEKQRRKNKQRVAQLNEILRLQELKRKARERSE